MSNWFPGDGEALRLKQLEFDTLQKSFNELVESSREVEEELESMLKASDLKLQESESKCSVLSTKISILQDSMQIMSNDNSKVCRQIESFEKEVTKSRVLQKQLEDENESLLEKVRILETSEEIEKRKVEEVEEENIFIKGDLDALIMSSQETERNLVEVKSEYQQLWDTYVSPNRLCNESSSSSPPGSPVIPCNLVLSGDDDEMNSSLADEAEESKAMVMDDLALHQLEIPDDRMQATRGISVTTISKGTSTSPTLIEDDGPGASNDALLRREWQRLQDQEHAFTNHMTMKLDQQQAEFNHKLASTIQEVYSRHNIETQDKDREIQQLNAEGKQLKKSLILANKDFDKFKSDVNKTTEEVALLQNMLTNGLETELSRCVSELKEAKETSLGFQFKLSELQCQESMSRDRYLVEKMYVESHWADEMKKKSSAWRSERDALYVCCMEQHDVIRQLQEWKRNSVTDRLCLSGTGGVNSINSNTKLDFTKVQIPLISPIYASVNVDKMTFDSTNCIVEDMFSGDADGGNASEDDTAADVDALLGFDTTTDHKHASHSPSKSKKALSKERNRTASTSISSSKQQHEAKLGPPHNIRLNHHHNRGADNTDNSIGFFNSVKLSDLDAKILLNSGNGNDLISNFAALTASNAKLTSKLNALTLQVYLRFREPGDKNDDVVYNGRLAQRLHGCWNNLLMPGLSCSTLTYGLSQKKTYHTILSRAVYDMASDIKGTCACVLLVGGPMSGKTYTCCGKDGALGLLSRTFTSLFDLLDKKQFAAEERVAASSDAAGLFYYRVQMSMYDIRNSSVGMDSNGIHSSAPVVLNWLVDKEVRSDAPAHPGKSMGNMSAAHADASRDLTFVTVSDLDHAMHLYTLGSANRAQSVCFAGSEESASNTRTRDHALCVIKVTHGLTNRTDSIVSSTLCFVEMSGDTESLSTPEDGDVTASKMKEVEEQQRISHVVPHIGPFFDPTCKPSALSNALKNVFPSGAVATTTPDTVNTVDVGAMSLMLSADKENHLDSGMTTSQHQRWGLESRENHCGVHFNVIHCLQCEE